MIGTCVNACHVWGTFRFYVSEDMVCLHMQQKHIPPELTWVILTSAKDILAMVMIFSDARPLSLADTVSRNTYIHHTGAVRVARLCLTYSLRSIKRLRCDILL